MHCSSRQPLLGACNASTIKTVVARHVQQPSRASSVQPAAVGDFFKDIFDFNSWAPKSTRIWRLQQYQPPEAEETSGDADNTTAEGLQGLQARINELRDAEGPSPAAAGAGSSSSWGPSSSFDQQSPSSSSTDSTAADLYADYDGFDNATGSFSDAEDSEVSAALSRRIKQIATTTGEWGSSVDEEEMRQPLTGEEIRQLLITKYGKQYDMSFVRRNLPGMGACVSLNIMWLHADQASFKMTAAQYQDKLDSVAQLVNVLGQTDKVRAFLRAPAKSMKGLPRRPVVGTAISIRLDLDKAQISEWFGQGYD